MKKFLILLISLVILTGAAAAVAGEETDGMAEIVVHDIPDVIDRTKDPEAEAEFSFPEDAALLHIWFPNIMNADEAILIYGDEVWLIDCGDERMGKRGAELLQKLGVPGIGRLFNTHPHHDHLNGLKDTDLTAKVDELLICFTEENIRQASALKHFRNAMDYAEKHDITVTLFEEGDVFTMGEGDVTLTCYVNGEPSLDVNNRSAQIMLRYGERSILFAADMEKPGQAAMLERVPAEELNADLLKYPHHGKNAMDDLFLEAVSPAAAIVTNKSVPDWKGIRYLKKMGIPFAYTNVYVSGKCQYLHLVTDGAHWIMERVGRDDVPDMFPEAGTAEGDPAE